MGTNPFFNNYNHDSERQLHKELTQEVIQQRGVDVFYLPRTRNNVSNILTEDNLSSFDNAYEIEMYFEDVESFGGQGDFLTKFGIEIADTATFTVSTLSFEKCVPCKIIPEEGDLIYWPLHENSTVHGGSIFEIHFVEDEDPFYQFGDVSSYKLSCKLFQYSSERFNTGIPKLDIIQNLNAFVVDVTLDTGSGNYLLGEHVHQPDTAVVGTVASWDATLKMVGLQDLTDAIDATATLVGNTSGTVYTIATFDEIEFSHDTAAQNQSFETNSNTFANYDSESPFGAW